jgi:hypothetical protein
MISEAVLVDLTDWVDCLLILRLIALLIALLIVFLRSLLYWLY